MKREKWVLALTLLLIVSLMTACGGGKASPKNAAENYLKAVQKQDFEGAKAYLSDGSSENFNLAGTPLSEGEAMKPLEDAMKEKIAGLTYTIKEEKVDGEKATVTAEMTYNDLSDAFNTAFSEMMTVLMDGSVDMMNMDDAAIEKLTVESFTKAMAASEAKKTETVVINMVQKDGKWLIDTENNAVLLNALSCNLFNFLGDSFGMEETPAAS